MEANVKRARRLGIILGAVASAALAAAACSDESTSGGSGSMTSIAAAANDPNIEMPVDATPSPDGTEIYFIANSKVAGEDNLGFERKAAIFKVAATGGPITKLFQGEPLVSPFGITISGDGQTLYIADSGSETSEERAGGRVFSLGVGGGAPTPLAGTEGLAPGGVEVSGDALYITGRRDGRAGLFKTGLAGGGVAEVAVGAAFSDPSGVAIAKNGDAYVVDTGSAIHGPALASVVKVSPDGKTEVVLEGLAVGHPAGIALAADDGKIFVSGFDAEKGTDVVFTIDPKTREVGMFTDQISEFMESAGLHRARNLNVFAWADSHANRTGTVYVLKTQ